MTPFETFALRVLYALLTVFVTGSSVYVAKLAGTSVGDVVNASGQVSGISLSSSSTDNGRLQKAPEEGAAVAGTVPDLSTDVFPAADGARRVSRHASRR